MTDYYDLLGIESGADKEVVRAAYRDQLEGASQSEKAKLNKAWNVLSDPVQRGRYDEYLASDSEFGADDGADDEDDDAAPSRPVRGGRAPRERGSRAPARPPLEPTIELPRGMDFAPKRSRNLAFMVDFAIVLLIVMSSIQLFPQFFDADYQDNVKQSERLIKQLDRATTRRDDAKDAASTARDRAKRAGRNGDDIAATGQRAIAEKKDAVAKTEQAKMDRIEDETTKVFDKMTGPRLAATGIALAIALAVTVPMSAKTGKTIGKRFQRIRLVRVDGSPAGWWPSFVHFGVPLALGIFVSSALPPLGTFAGVGAVGMVLWNLRDRNRQGVHDKLAKTLVVSDAG